MLCEIQLRTHDQHAWATAVEVAGFFLGQDLKAGTGNQDWLRFFALAAGAIALKEKRAPVPGVPSDKAKLLDELEDIAEHLDVINWFGGFHFAPTIARRSKRGAFWFLLTLNSETKMVDWNDYTVDETDKANEDYEEAERAAMEDDSINVVLVSADGMKALKTAYPSFFGDTQGFQHLVKSLLEH